MGERIEGGSSGRSGIIWRSAKGCEGVGGCGVSTWRYQGMGSDEDATKFGCDSGTEALLSSD